MDQVSFEEMNLKDFLKDNLSFTSSDSRVIFYKGHFKGQIVL